MLQIEGNLFGAPREQTGVLEPSDLGASHAARGREAIGDATDRPHLLERHRLSAMAARQARPEKPVPGGATFMDLLSGLAPRRPG